MAYIRENVNGTTPQDINKLNENFMSIWQKVFGDIDFSDATNNLKEKICTQWIPVQGEGNFDKNNDIKIRFFVPPNTKKIKTSSFNFIAEQYRMDSDIALGGGGYVGGSIALNMSPSNAVISSSLDGITESKYVQEWGAPAMQKIIPTDAFKDYGDLAPPNENLEYITRYWTEHYYAMTIGSKTGLLMPCIRGSYDGTRGWYLDSALVQHKHDISHTHSFSVKDLGHTHSGSVSVNIPAHPHDLNEGIKVSTQDIGTIIVNVNGTDLFTMSSSNRTKNDIDITKNINIGQWNTISVSTNTLARIVMYGTIELITNFL